MQCLVEGLELRTSHTITKPSILSFLADGKLKELFEKLFFFTQNLIFYLHVLTNKSIVYSKRNIFYAKIFFLNKDCVTRLNFPKSFAVKCCDKNVISKQL